MSFDKSVEEILSASPLERQTVYRRLLAMPYTMLCFRWRYDTDILFRNVVRHAIKDISKHTSAPIHRERICAQQDAILSFASQLSEMKARVTGTDLEEVSVACTEIGGDNELLEHLLALAHEIPGVPSMINGVLSGLARSYTARRLPVLYRVRCVAPSTV